MENQHQDVDSFLQKTDSQASLTPTPITAPDNADEDSQDNPDIDTAAVLRSVMQSDLETDSEPQIITGRKELMLQTMRETEFYQYLMLASDVEDFKRRILVLINKLGLTDFGFMLMDTNKEVDGKLVSSPNELLETYYSEEFYKHDMLWKYLAINNAPTYQSVIHNFIKTAPFETEELLRNKELAKLTESYGYLDYYILPMDSHSGGRCILFVYGVNMPTSILQAHIDMCKGRLELLCCAVDYIASIRFTRVIRGSHRSAEINLTARPRELLMHLAVNDCNLNQAAEAMSISVKTANVHIANVKKAFGVSTSTAAVAQAIKYGFITLDALGK